MPISQLTTKQSEGFLAVCESITAAGSLSRNRRTHRVTHNSMSLGINIEHVVNVNTDNGDSRSQQSIADAICAPTISRRPICMPYLGG